MDKGAFKKMVTNKGGLISFNSFLSTSKVRSISLAFAQRALTNDQMVGVLFVMNIDPAQSSASFASVVDVSYFDKKEDEVLFSMHSVFRIGEITPVGGNARLVQVQMSLASDKDNDLRELIDYIRKETSADSGKAERVYEILLRQETRESAKAQIYGQLGVMKQEQGEFAGAIAYFGKSIEVEKKQIPRRDKNLANSYNNIVLVYFSMGDYPKALSSYKEALTIQEQSLPPTHLDLAISFSNIGSVYFNMGDYSIAHLCFERAVNIAQILLSANHPSLQMYRNNFDRIRNKL